MEQRDDVTGGAGELPPAPAALAEALRFDAASGSAARRSAVALPRHETWEGIDLRMNSLKEAVRQQAAQAVARKQG